MSYSYNHLEYSKLPYQNLMQPIEAATSALSRLDERLLRTPRLASGFVSRNHYLETCSNIWMDGELVHLKDLILHDMQANISPPSHEVIRASRLLFLHRKFSKLDVKTQITETNFHALIEPNDHNDFAPQPLSTLSEFENEKKLLDEIDAVTERSQNLVDQLKQGKKITLSQKEKQSAEKKTQEPLQEWFALLNLSDQYPAVLTAAILLDAWLMLKPIENGNNIGRLMVAYILKQRLSHNLLPPINKGMQKSKRRWQAHDKLEARIKNIILGFALAGQEAMGELDRLSLAHERMMLSAKNCRVNSSLPALINLFIEMPLLSTATAAKLLKITPRAVDQLLKQLGPAIPRERTGRGRYRFWGII